MHLLHIRRSAGGDKYRRRSNMTGQCGQRDTGAHFPESGLINQVLVGKLAFKLSQVLVEAQKHRKADDGRLTGGGHLNIWHESLLHALNR